MVEGETNITARSVALKRVWLKPEDCRATEEALDAIDNADLIIYGPGSLYTSVLPNLLIKDIMDRILECEARKFYIANVMTQPGETDGFSVFDHLSQLIQHTDPRIIDAVFVNTAIIPDYLLTRYGSQNAYPARLDVDLIRERGYEVVEAEMVRLGEQVRHDPEKLAKFIFEEFFQLNTKEGKVSVLK